MEEEHLVRFYADEDSSFDDHNSSDDNSSVEATSSIDECENELVRLSTYLQLESDYENDDDQAIEWPEPPPSLISPDSSDIEELCDSQQVISSATSFHNDNIQKKCTKRKRRQWTIKENLIAVALFDKNQSKRKTAKSEGCTSSQLRKWIENKENLLMMLKKKKGGKRKRLDGGGKNLFTLILMINFLLADIRREKVTFRHLEKEGRRISKELNHSLPSSSWFFRFMKRNGLSLQRPKRQDKVPLDEVHRLANSFYTFNRRASLWSIKRGPMGAFTDGDICNMDESPLALFGDQVKRSVNDIGTSNEINGCISNKRFCTVILTVFHKNQRMEPVVLFKGKGNVGVAERQQYSKGIHVIFTPKAVHDGHPKLFIADSANSHLKPEIIQKLRKKNVVVSIIPKGCTQYLQLLDTSVFSVFKNHYQAAADEYIDLYSSRSKIKLAAKQQRILCTRLISTAWVRTQNSIDFERAFFDIGYTWIDESPVSIRTLQGFLFDPSTVTSSIIDVDDREEQEECREKKKMVEENKKHPHLSSMNNNSKLKQLSLDQFIKN
ncbi:unnamed protein product [Rotaria magnacalcarata]|uniref:HTH CENPB-type domain-containing protein n=1 Tax=Rotaria magnacalcarata TaxID=392030 RepID=A0A816SAI2_9BILA|nr:unnamed protein product [Rotaria magnacalcarata]